MTRALALLFLLCAGCAATNRGTGVPLGGSPASVSPRSATSPGVAWSVSLAGPDSAWITFTVPATGSPNGCEPDTTRQHDARTVDVLRLNTVQPPNYRRGCEADSACWDSVKVFNVPSLVARLERLAPGQRCSVRVAAGLYTTVTSNPVASSCWSRGLRVGQ